MQGDYLIFNLAIFAYLVHFQSFTGNCHKTSEISLLPASIYLFKVNNGNTGTMSKICSKTTRKTPERRRPGVFIFNFEQVLHIGLMFQLLQCQVDLYLKTLTRKFQKLLLALIGQKFTHVKLISCHFKYSKYTVAPYSFRSSRSKTFGNNAPAVDSTEAALHKCS